MIDVGIGPGLYEISIVQEASNDGFEQDIEGTVYSIYVNQFFSFNRLFWFSFTRAKKIL